MAFSGALALTDLNDFITPSQACIKPVEVVEPVDAPKGAGSAAVRLEVFILDFIRLLSLPSDRLKYR